MRERERVWISQKRRYLQYLVAWFLKKREMEKNKFIIALYACQLIKDAKNNYF